MEAVIYVLGNDLHRFRQRNALVVRRHTDDACDLVVFLDPDEARHEGGSTVPGENVPCVFKRRVPRDDGKKNDKNELVFRAVSWHANPDDHRVLGALEAITKASSPPGPAPSVAEATPPAPATPK